MSQAKAYRLRLLPAAEFPQAAAVFRRRRAEILRRAESQWAAHRCPAETRHRLRPATNPGAADPAGAPAEGGENFRKTLNLIRVFKGKIFFWPQFYIFLAKK